MAADSMILLLKRRADIWVCRALAATDYQAALRHYDAAGGPSRAALESYSAVLASCANASPACAAKLHFNRAGAHLAQDAIADAIADSLRVSGNGRGPDLCQGGASMLDAVLVFGGKPIRQNEHNSCGCCIRGLPTCQAWNEGIANMRSGRHHARSLQVPKIPRNASNILHHSFNAEHFQCMTNVSVGEQCSVACRRIRDLQACWWTASYSMLHLRP